MNIDSNLIVLEEELQQLLDIPMCYWGISEDGWETGYFWTEKSAWENDMNPYSKGYIKLTSDDYLYFLLFMSKIVKIETLSNTLDVKAFKEDICFMCIRYLKLLKEVDPDNYQVLYDGLKTRIQENVC